MAGKRSHKKMDPDIKALKACLRSISELTPRMQRATAEYLYDRFVRNPPPHVEIQPARPKEG